MGVLLNQLPALTVRLFTPWNGVWYADVDVALDETEIVPFGPCVLTLGTVPLVGTVDPRSSGKFGKSARVRVLGGGGGWHKDVIPMHVHNPAAVLSTVVYAAAAAEVQEVVVDVAPRPLGQDFVRFGGLPLVGPPGPASRVFGKADWYVSFQGITFVGPRVPQPYNPLTTEILSYDPLTRSAELACEDPIAPGTILLDPLRFSGPLIVRDVEQTWSADGGARATVWCAEGAGSRLQTALVNLVSERAGLPFLKTYRYRVILQDPTSEALILQPIDPTWTGAPYAIPFDMWCGVPGIHAKVTPGTEVLVWFTADDPPRPVVCAFKQGVDQMPILIEMGTGLKGPVALAVGTQAQMTAIAVAIAALATYVAAFTTLAATPPTSTSWTLTGVALAAPGAALATALATLATAIPAAVPAATSTLVVSD